MAITTADRAAMEKLLDADFTWTKVEGKVLSRAQVLAKLPPTAMADATKAEVKSYTYGDLGNVQMNLGRAHELHV